MTNEQLKILLEYNIALLEKSISEATDLLPEDLEREKELVYVGPEYTKETSIQNMNNNINSKNWEEKPVGRFIALLPLYEHLELLEEHVMNLKSE